MSTNEGSRKKGDTKSRGGGSKNPGRGGKKSKHNPIKIPQRVDVSTEPQLNDKPIEETIEQIKKTSNVKNISSARKKIPFSNDLMKDEDLKRVQMLMNTLKTSEKRGSWSNDAFEVSNQVASLVKELKSQYLKKDMVAHENLVTAVNDFAAVISASDLSFIGILSQNTDEDGNYINPFTRGFRANTYLFRNFFNQMFDNVEPINTNMSIEEADEELERIIDLTPDSESDSDVAQIPESALINILPKYDDREMVADDTNYQTAMILFHNNLLEDVARSVNAVDVDPVEVASGKSDSDSVSDTITGRLSDKDSFEFEKDDDEDYENVEPLSQLNYYDIDNKFRIRFKSQADQDKAMESAENLRRAENIIANINKRKKSEHEELIEVLELFVVPGANNNMSPSSLKSHDLIDYLMRYTKTPKEVYSDSVVVLSDASGNATEAGTFISNFSEGVEAVVETIRENGLSYANPLNDKMIEEIMYRTLKTSPLKASYTSKLTDELIKMNKIVEYNYNPILLHSLFKTPLSDAAKRIYEEWTETKRSLTINQLIKITERYYKKNPRLIGVGTFLDKSLRRPFDEGITFADLKSTAQDIKQISREDLDVLIGILGKRVKD